MPSRFVTAHFGRDDRERALVGNSAVNRKEGDGVD